MFVFTAQSMRSEKRTFAIPPHVPEQRLLPFGCIFELRPSILGSPPGSQDSARCSSLVSESGFPSLRVHVSEIRLARALQSPLLAPPQKQERKQDRRPTALLCSATGSPRVQPPPPAAQAQDEPGLAFANRSLRHIPCVSEALEMEYVLLCVKKKNQFLSTPSATGMGWIVDRRGIC